MKQARTQAIKVAREIIASNPIYLDTETTGLDTRAEIVDIAVIDHDGVELLNTLIRPISPISTGAIDIHGITNEDVIGAPTYVDIQPNLSSLNDRLVVIYNADFDLRLMGQTSEANKIENWEPENFVCAMKLYAEFHGDWNNHHQSYRWQKQSNAAQQLGIKIPFDLHRAASDANLCRLIIEAMAVTPLPGEGK